MNSYFKHIIHLCTLFLLMISCDTPESLKPIKQQVFVKLYGGIQDERGYDLIQLDDGGYILVGSTTSISNGGEDIYLVRTDAGGNEIWSRNIGGEADEIGRSIILSNDNNAVIVVGDIAQGGTPSDIYLLKASLNGDMLNEAQFGDIEISETGVEVVQAPQGGYLVGGNINFVDSAKIYFVEVTEDFSVKPNRERNDLGVQGQNNKLSSVIYYEEDKYLAFGTTTGGISGTNLNTQNFLLIDVNAEGLIGGTYFYGNNDDEIGLSLSRAPGGYIMGGYKINDSNIPVPMSIKVNNNLEVMWEKVYSDIRGNEEMNMSVIPSDDQGYTILLETEQPQVGSEMGFVKIDAQGDVLWKSSFGSEGDDKVGDFIQLEDGSYVAVGSFDFTVNNEDLFKMGMAKTNPVGTLVPVE